MGRNKQFERDDVVEKALYAFWRKGYIDTSLKDLEEATGVFKPALYSEFGDKEGLFLECVRHYRKHYSGQLLLLREPLGWKNIEDFLKSVLPRKGEKGCFEALTFARDVHVLGKKLKPLLNEQAEKIAEAIKNNLKTSGVQTAKLDTLTGMIFTFYCGLSVLASSQPRKELEQQAINFLEYVRN
jgi:TetR/AcrR family transcriptional regulator, copper-responsive repressor